MNTCRKMLQEQIQNSTTPFSIQVPDLIAALLNYGTTQSKLWPEDIKISLPSRFKSMPIDHLDVRACHEPIVAFPFENLDLILRLLLFNLEVFPNYTENEKFGLFHLMLNLLMDNMVVSSSNLLTIIKNITVSIFESFTDEEWAELDYKKVLSISTSCDRWKQNRLSLTRVLLG